MSSVLTSSCLKERINKSSNPNPRTYLEPCGTSLWQSICSRASFYICDRSLNTSLQYVRNIAKNILFYLDSHFSFANWMLVYSPETRICEQIKQLRWIPYSFTILKMLRMTLHEKCPYLDFFWSECGKIQARKTPNSTLFTQYEKNRFWIIAKSLRHIELFPNLDFFVCRMKKILAKYISLNPFES